jgi:DNA-binding NarL/FixJ family response regulator
MAEVQRLQPDVVLTDLRMPEVEGVEAIVELRRIHANLRILVLTNHQEDEYIFRAFQAGAMGYLLKSTPQEEIVQAVEMVHQNKRYVPPNIAERLLKTITREELPKKIRSKALRGRISSSTIKAGSNRSRSLRRNLRMSCLPGRPLSPRRKRPRSALLHWEGL